MNSQSVDHVHDFICLPGLFSRSECMEIVESARAHQLHRSETYGGTNDPHRKSRELRVPPDEEPWLSMHHKLWANLIAINQQYFRFDISGINEDIRFIQYESPDSHFDWHVDRMAGIQVRKLSFSLQLDEPENYDGGLLKFDIGEKYSATRECGTLVVFPSYLLHKVTPVTRGVRRAIVGWVTGPAFR